MALSIGRNCTFAAPCGNKVMYNVEGDRSMPVHNWNSTAVGLFHHFHQQWACILCDQLNSRDLPDGYYALLTTREFEFREAHPIDDIEDDRAICAITHPPQVRFVSRAGDEEVYAAKANQITIRNPLGKVVAMIEVVSPGNKNSQHNLRTFVDKTLEFLRQGISVSVIDLFSPSKRDPQGLHALIWSEIHDEPFTLPADKPLTIASYVADIPKSAYVDFVAPGDVLPSTPVFLNPARYVPVPLEQTYTAAWNACPVPLKNAVLKTGQ
jgi:hypothetical protein